MNTGEVKARAMAQAPTESHEEFPATLPADSPADTMADTMADSSPSDGAAVVAKSYAKSSYTDNRTVSSDGSVSTSSNDSESESEIISGEIREGGQHGSTAEYIPADQRATVSHDIAGDIPDVVAPESAAPSQITAPNTSGRISTTKSSTANIIADTNTTSSSPPSLPSTLNTLKSTHDELLHILNSFPKPPNDTPGVQGWGDDRRGGEGGARKRATSNGRDAKICPTPLDGASSQTNAIATNDSETFTSSTTTHPSDSTIELFAAFSSGKISASQLERLRTALVTLDSTALTACSLNAFKIASTDEDVYDRAQAMNRTTPRNRGLTTRIKGMFGKGLGNQPVARLSTTAIHFGDVDLGKTARVTITVHNDGRHKFFFRAESVTFPGPDIAAYAPHTLRFIPEDSTCLVEGDHIMVRKRQSAMLHLELTPKKSSVDMIAPFVLRFASGPVILAVCRARVRRTVFGVGLDALDMAEESGDEMERTAGEKQQQKQQKQQQQQTERQWRRVPRVLVELRNSLIERGGLSVEGIFRIAADETEIPAVRAALNAGEFSILETLRDINCVSAMIKVFFRELPEPVLSGLPRESLVAVSCKADSLAALEQLPRQSRDLLMWIVELMCDVVDHASENKMSAKSCAIVMGPNLYHVASNVAANLMQALILSQKAVQFLEHLIEHMGECRRAASGIGSS